jgi:eukaryotic-like serine/threonine-protein kinase
MQPAEAEDPLWAEAKRLFAAALELTSDRRAEYLEAECRDKPALRGEVESLLDNHARADNFFELIPLHAQKDPLIGRRFGAWRLLREIGRGGMGVVYLAERADDQFRRRVAVKAVRPGFLDEQTLRRFENERRMLAVLDHPNIIRLLDSGITNDGIPFLVTDYVEGQAIDQFCDARGLSVKERLRLFREVLSAVHYAHQNLVVHRDLKPSNILVTPDGVPKLLDFGIARILRPEYLGGPMALTRTAMQPLTPEFASPEQVRGQPVTTASDIYSLGVILYRLLTGHHPFEGKLGSVLELERAVCETEPAPPSTLARGATGREAAAARLLRGDPDNIVLKAMRLEPQLRYPSAQHFSEDIRLYLDGYPITARRLSLWYRASRFAGRHQVSCAAAAVFTIAIAVSAAAAIREQRLAARRFTELRSFANFVIRDFDSTLRQGVTPARRKLNEEALRYLDGLAKEAGGDPVVRLDLAEGYTRAGDVLGNPNGSSLGDMQAAENSYAKAIAIAGELSRSGARDAASELALARAQIGMADVLWPRGKMDGAIELYQAAIRETDGVLKATRDKDAVRVGFRAWDHLMAANENRNDIAAAIASAQQCLRYAEEIGARDLQAYVHEREGRFLVLDGKAADGEHEIERAVATYEALDYMTGATPKRKTLAEAYKSLGDAERAGGKLDAAEQSYRRSVADAERLSSEDSRSAPLQLDVGQANTALIDLLLAAGKKPEAHSQTVHALGQLRPIAEAPAATTWQMYYYGWLLVTTPFPDLSDSAAVMKLTARMMQKDPGDAEVLDLAARASARAGDIEGALMFEQKALAANPLPEVRARIEDEIKAVRKPSEK